jgi:hypothetical protein
MYADLGKLLKKTIFKDKESQSKVGDDTKSLIVLYKKAKFAYESDVAPEYTLAMFESDRSHLMEQVWFRVFPQIVKACKNTSFSYGFSMDDCLAESFVILEHCMNDFNEELTIFFSIFYIRRLQAHLQYKRQQETRIEKRELPMSEYMEPGE